MTKATMKTAGSLAQPISGGRLFLSVLGIILIVVAAYFTVYFLGNKYKNMQTGRNIKVLDQFSLSRDKTIYILEIAQKVYIVAMTNQSITVIDTLDIDSFEEIQANLPPHKQAYDTMQKGVEKSGNFIKDFIAAFKHNWSEKFGKNQDQDNKGQDVKSVSDLLDNQEIDAVYRKIQARSAQSSFDESIDEIIDDKDIGGVSDDNDSSGFDMYISQDTKDYKDTLKDRQDQVKNSTQKLQNTVDDFKSSMQKAQSKQKLESDKNAPNTKGESDSHD